MAKDEKKEEPEAPDPPMTTQDFTEALNKLTDRAKAAGVNTVKAMVLVGLGEALKVLDSVAEGLEGGTRKAKPKGKKKAPRA